MRWIGELNKRFLRRKARIGSTLVLAYATQARDQVEALVRAERECCAALAFTMQDTSEGIELRITVPSRVADQADLLLQPFESDVTVTGTDCCGACDMPAPATVKSTSAANSALGSSAVAVIACGACCLLPVAFPAVAAGATGTVLAALAAGHGWLTGLAAITLVGAWGWIWQQSRKRRVRLARSTVVQMGAATFLMALALGWRWIEPPLMATLAR
jgi:hypothetical protein